LTSPLFPYTTLFRSRDPFLQPRLDLAGVDVDPADDDPVPASIVHQRLRRVETHRLVVEQRGGEDSWIVSLEPGAGVDQIGEAVRSEEHTSELQSREN